VFTLTDSHDLGTYRAVSSQGVGDFEAFLASPPAAALITSGSIVRSAPVDGVRREMLLAGREDVSLLLERERLPFPSYPAEWPPEMLHAAASLTLELARIFLPHQIGLKDATPYNVLFRGPRPVFVDVLSFERRDPVDCTWAAYGQFLRTFLLPLLAYGRLHMPLDQIFATRRDGLEPQEVWHWTPLFKRLMPPFLSLATLPVWLAARRNPQDVGFYGKRMVGDPEKARYILDALFRRLAKLLAAVAPAVGRKSNWSRYLLSNCHYSATHFADKQNFVRDALAGFAPQRVLDIGCNTGHFSVMAAQSGADVTAIDCDPVATGALWRRALFENLPILPLVVNIARPTAAGGWNNCETASFLDRARGHFDAVMMLALIHHLLVSERIPLDAILDLAADCVANSPVGIVLIEYIAPEDPMFQRLVRGRDEWYRQLTRSSFEMAARRRFDIVRTEHGDGAHRWLYLLRRKS
jgi:SAM-dependent methyltransferase